MMNKGSLRHTHKGFSVVINFHFSKTLKYNRVPCHYYMAIVRGVWNYATIYSARLLLHVAIVVVVAVSDRKRPITLRGIAPFDGRREKRTCSTVARS